MGSHGHASKQVISTKHLQCAKLIYNEPLMDEHRNTNAKGHLKGNVSTYLLTYMHAIKAEISSTISFSRCQYSLTFFPNPLDNLHQVATRHGFVVAAIFHSS